jgi:uncharacterized protein YcnI
MHRMTRAAFVAAGALAVPAAAQAHVTVQPDTAAAGAFVVESVRVPNERDDASTVKVDVQLPPGFIEASYQPIPGWSVTVTKQKLAKPMQTDDGPVDEQVRRIAFTGHGPTGKIAPGQFMDFPLSVQVPGKPGDKLTFKALQTYSNGDVVRWIGAPDSETPAPIVNVVAAPTSGVSRASEASDASDASDTGGASQGLGIAALVLGALGLVAGLLALGARRRGVRIG